MKDLYRGTLVRLASESPETMSKSFVKWDRDSESHRLVTSAPGQLWSEKKLKELAEKSNEMSENGFLLSASVIIGAGALAPMPCA